MPNASSDDRSFRDDRPARDDDDAVTDDVIGALLVLHAAAVDDLHAPADAAVLVEDGVLDHRPLADEEVGEAAAAVGGPLGVGFVAVGADHDGVAQGGVPADNAADADDAPLQPGPGLHHAAVA